MWLAIWLVVAAVMIVAEIISLGLTSIWFAGGALAAALAVGLGANWMVQIVIFAAVSILLLVFTRPIVSKRMMTKTEKTNVDSLIGKKVVVKETIDNLNSKGSVMANGLEWTARSSDDSKIEMGKTVEILEVEGVKLIVKLAE